MDLTPTEDQELIQSTARELLEQRSATAGVRPVADRCGYSPDLWKEIVELGWTGLSIPETHGGAGAGFLETCLLLEEMGAALVPGPLLTTTACAALPIARFGSSEQRSTWLADIADGLAVTYVRATPREDWDASGSTVQATPDGDGGFVLHGTADFVPYAEGADRAVVVASTTSGPAVLLTGPVDDPGIHVERLPVLGREPQYRVRFGEIRVPAEQVLGRPPDGEAVIGAIDAFGAVATCAVMVGGARRVLDMTVEHANVRQQFRRPIGTFQAVQHTCADIAVDVASARLLTYEAAWRLDQEAGCGDDLRHTLTVSPAKAWVGEAYRRTCARSHQIHGAIGFTAEHDLHLFREHAMSAALTFGDEVLHTQRIAAALGLPES